MDHWSVYLNLYKSLKWGFARSPEGFVRTVYVHIGPLTVTIELDRGYGDNA